MSRAVAVFAESLERRVLLSVSLVKDINAGNLGSTPNEFAAAGAGVIFRAQRASDAWVSDGSAAGTVAVPGLTEGGVQPGTFNGEAYFQGLSQSTGIGLWKSDGTVAGTVLVVPGLNWGPGIVAAGDRFYFFGLEGGSTEGLWSSDGTAGGTRVVSALPENLGVDSVSVGDQVNFEIAGNDGKCCYVLRDNTATQRQVWVSDGTAAGTQLLIDNIGKNQALVAPSADGGFYVFVAGGPSQGLYKTDGTRSGTTLVAQMGGDPSFNNQLAVVGNEAFFTGNDNVNGTQLWVSDGTPAGTQMPLQIGAPGNLQFFNFTAVNGALIFDVVDSGSGWQGMWRTDGTALGSGRMQQFVRPAGGWQPITVAGDEAYFAANDGTSGLQLWKTDGNYHTSEVAAINPVGTSNPTNLTAAANGELFFSADDGIHGTELWKSDGTADGTQLVKDINTQPASSTPQNLIDVGGMLFFDATDQFGQQIWKSDGTAAGTVRVTDLNPDEPGTFGIQNLTNFNGTVYFTTGSGKLWKTDGTPSGTVQVLAVNPNVFAGPISQLTPVGNELFFLVSSGLDLQLWRTDGSPQGTFALATWPNQFALNRGNPQLTPFRGGVVFQAMSGNTPQLWHSDGTFAGTGPLTNLPALPVGGQLSTANLFASAGVVGNTFYFVNSQTRMLPGATQPVMVHDLWKTDGTAGGTTKLVSNFSFSPTAFFDAGGVAEFFATLSTPALWALDPGTGSATQVSPIPQLPVQSATLGGKLYFFPGPALWLSDGTSAGTRQVATLPSTLFANSGQVITGDGMLFFNDRLAGLWRSDGTPAGTAPIIAQPFSSLPTFMVFSANRLFFSANDPSVGTELYAADASIPGGVFNDANHDGIRELSEAGLPGVTVFLDTNNNGVLDPGEPSTVTDSNGNFVFNGLARGNYVVRQILPAGYVQTTLRPTTIAVAIGDNPGGSFGDAPAANVPLNFSFLLTLAQHYGQSGSFANGDLNGDGQVNFDDLLILAQNYHR